MLIQIDGWFGSGKSVLWMLLDGHPDVFCSPIHDYSYAAFLNQGDEFDWIKTRHIEILRKVLARTQYYKFEKVFWDGFMSFEFSSDKVLNIPYNINYYRFDYRFIESLAHSPDWNIEFIIDNLYHSIFLETNSSIAKKTQINPKYFASMSNAIFIDDYTRFPLIFPNGKSIQVRRPVEDIIAVRSTRKPRKEDFKTWRFFSDNFETRINDGEVERILHFYDTYDDLVKKYPDAFMIIDFHDLNYSTEKTMKKVADFLKISWHDILSVATYQGTEITYDGKKYIGQINDSAADLLTMEEMQIIRDRIKMYYDENRV